MAQSKEVEKAPDPVDLLLGAAAAPVEDNEAMLRSIIERNLAATTDEELFEERGSVATKDLVGEPLRVMSVRLAQGEIDGKPTTYMLADAYNIGTGEKLLVNTGSPQIMSKLYNLHLRGRLPFNVYVVEAAPASKGRNAVLSIRACAEGITLHESIKD